MKTGILSCAADAGGRLGGRGHRLLAERLVPQEQFRWDVVEASLRTHVQRLPQSPGLRGTNPEWRALYRSRRGRPDESPVVVTGVP